MNYYDKIKKELIDNELFKKAKDYSKNKSDLEHYYNVGKLLIEAQGGEARAKYGDGLIKEYSKRLTIDLGKGYDVSALKRMRKLYLISKKGVTVSHLLKWSHYIEILPLNNINEINYYIDITSNQNLSVRELREKIKNKEYQRLDDNTKNKLIKKEEASVIDFVKNPITIRNSVDKENVSEKYLKYLILEDLDHFLSELGNGFTYVGNEYKIKIDNRYNYIDILLYNIIHNCYIVVELNVVELSKEHIGQIEIYMNYVDRHVKAFGQNKTIGIILCKKDNKLLLGYCSDKSIFSTTYSLV